MLVANFTKHSRSFGVIFRVTDDTELRFGFLSTRSASAAVPNLLQRCVPSSFMTKASANVGRMGREMALALQPAV